VRIGVVTKPGLAEARGTLVELATWLDDRQIESWWSLEAADLVTTPPAHVADRSHLPSRVDLVLVLGGDGTLLAMADRIAAADRDIPILGVNFGSLGFLTEITRPELFSSLAAAVSGRATYDDRMMLAARSQRADGRNGTRHIALNEVVFTRTALSRMIDVSVWVGDQFVATFRADGLIVASPTGSTAYSLSAGGPIVHPAMEAIVITPIAPHTLTNRPVVIPAEREVRVEPAGTNAPGDIYVTFDGQSGFPLAPGEEVTIARHARPLRLIRASARSYFEVLREKLKWHQG
jgi:NAD+ kinase